MPEALVLVGRASRTTRGRVGGALVLFVLLVAVIGPFVAPYGPTELSTTSYSPPGGGHLLGGDGLGRDVFSRVLAGGWELLLIAGATTILGVGLGAAAGITAAYASGRTDSFIMRVVDVFLAFPQLVFALLLISLLGAKVWLIIVAIVFTHAPQVARVIRSSALDVCERDFISAAELIAVRRWKMMTREILPSLTSPLMVEFGLRFTYSIILIGGLSFLGFGLQPPSPSWGTMINENRIGLSSNPWGVIAPALMLALLTVGVNTFTDAIARVALGGRRGAAAISLEGLKARSQSDD